MPQRSLFSCCVAEFLGTWILVFLGCGAVHSAVLTGALAGLGQVALVWGIGVMVGVYASAGVSGGHINPAMTIAFTVWGLFPIGRAIAYIVSQVAGAILAAALLYTIFQAPLAEKESERGVTRGQPGSEVTAMVYCEYYPNPDKAGKASGDALREALVKTQSYVPDTAAMLAEVLGTLILALVVSAVTDDKSAANPGRLAPLFIGLTVAGLICVIAPLTQACFNPARDFGPRLFAYAAGWGDIALPGPRGMGWLTVYILSPIVGATLGVGIYRQLLRAED
jgi:glycerol uptake facilitator protein